MSAGTTLHHHGLRVADADAAGAFYIEALGARWLARPVVFAGPGAELAMGVSGVSLKLGLLGIGDAALELFEFLGDDVPQWANAPVGRRLPHLGLQVEDVDAALVRIEAAGGRRLWDAVDRWGRARVIYAADPDGNVLELLDQPPVEIAAALHRWFPDSRPE
jgi:catechol 2,3-dioxygenase-like lactoylglutathione lyase family enzyme